MKVKAADGYTYYMAQALLDTVLGRLATEDKPVMKSLRLIRVRIWNAVNTNRFMPAQENVPKRAQERLLYTCDNYVTMTDGTGIVHIAPAFGEDDAESAVTMTFRCTVR